MGKMLISMMSKIQTLNSGNFETELRKVALCAPCFRELSVVKIRFCYRTLKFAKLLASD